MKQKLRTQKLRTQLSSGFALIVLITVALISITATLLINYQFEKYMEGQQKEFSDGLAEALCDQYDEQTGGWNQDYIHGFGMYALNDGYIIKLYDADGQMVWDAENHDMSLCHQIMSDISLRMQEIKPELKGNFVTGHYELKKNDTLVGYADINYYSPYYYNNNAFHFVGSLNLILLVIGILSLIGSVAAGLILAKKISNPIVKTMEITREISRGNYGIRFESEVRTKELNELSQAVNHMAKTLEEQEDLRKRLTTDVAHELRTPLANVSSYLEAMMEGIWEPKPERLRRCYDEIGRISVIVTDLQELSQIESENLELHKEQVDLLELAGVVQAAFESSFKAKSLTCIVEGESSIVSADRKRLHQVILNLLSNAVKYSAEGGLIQIVVQDSSQAGTLIVQDHGIGISKTDLPLIFERFYRTDRSRNRKTGGAGIGLSIVKSIVQAHDGEISVESEEGKGSRFQVVLPKE